MNKKINIDYKDSNSLSKFLNKQGRIMSRIYTKLSSYNQRKISIAIKTARQMAILPYNIIEQ